MSKYSISHAEMVAKLIKQPETLKAEFTEFDFGIMHAVIGIVGELGELLGGIEYSVVNQMPLDRQNLIEEFGDLEFYLEDFRTKAFFTLLDVQTCEDVCKIPNGLFPMSVHMMVYGTELLDQVKKSIIYRKKMNRTAVLAALSKIEYLKDQMYQRLNLLRGDILEANMDKLALRYNGFQYTDQRAQDRADKALGLPERQDATHPA